MHPSRRLALAFLCGAAIAPMAWAQTPRPVRLRATIEAVTPTDLKVTTRGGETVTLKLADNLSVSWIVPEPLSAIQPNDYIGVTAVPGDDGALKALEVHVLPGALRGAGEGHRPWDLAPNSTMTNGTVGSVKGTNGRTLTVAYKGGEQRIFVPENAPVVTYQPADRSALTKGAHIIAFGTENPDGSDTATRISVGKDGLVPPM